MVCARGGSMHTWRDDDRHGTIGAQPSIPSMMVGLKERYTHCTLSVRPSPPMNSPQDAAAAIQAASDA